MYRLYRLIPILTGMLMLVFFNGCFGSDACPAGWMKNATGDCIDSSNLPGNEDGDRVINPCPDGWVLNQDGFCINVSDDGDIDGDGNVPPTDGDEDSAEDGDGDGDIADGDQTPSYRTCEDDSDCQQAESCHFIRQGEGICLDACTESAFCRNYEAESYCNNEKRCIVGALPETCEEDMTCEYRQVCHPSANCGKGRCYAECRKDEHCSLIFTEEACDSDGDQDAEKAEEGDGDEPVDAFYCSAEYRCEPGQPPAICGSDSQCFADTLCHYQIEGGKCLPPCNGDPYCRNYGGDELICNTEERCIIADGVDCNTDFECRLNDVCHSAIDLCMAPCTGDSNCTPYGDLWCNSAGLCDNRPGHEGLACDDDLDCPINTRCHPEADDDGVCSAACTDTQDCLTRIGPGLFCNALNLCAPGVFPDGDEEEEIDGDEEDPPTDPCLEDTLCEAQHRVCIDNNGQAECGGCKNGYHEEGQDCVQGELCATLTEGGVWSINLETATIQVTAKKGGAPFTDTFGLSDIYLRDNSSSSMFAIYSNFSDGGALEAVEIIKGTFNLWVENRLGQKKEVLKGLEIYSDSEVDAEFPFHKISINLTKNDQAFPTLPVEWRGELKLYDTSARRTHLIGEVGAGEAGYSIDVFEGTYDIIFDGYLSADENARQIVTLIKSDKVETNRQYDLDLDTVHVSGNIDLGGSPGEAPEGGYGEVWLINAVNKDRFPFWPVDSADSLPFSREVVADSYYVAFKPPGEDGDSYLWRSETYEDWESDTAAAAIDIPLVHFTGEVKNKGGALYELYDADEELYLDRGKISLKDALTNETFTLVELGEQGAVNFDRWIGPGTYSYEFEGRLIEDNYYVSVSYPSSIHKMIWQSGVEITEDMSGIIDLPIETVTGQISITYDGQSLTDFTTATGDYISVKRSGTQDLPIFRFGKLEDFGSYSVLLFPATYEMKYYGSTLLGIFQNNYVYDSIMVTGAANNFDIDIATENLGVTVTANNGAKTLDDLIDEGSYTSADIRVSNEITRLQGSKVWDENGRFEILRPAGPIDLYLYLYKTEGSDKTSYLIVPLIEDYELSGPDELYFDLELLTFALEVTKNGEALPDSTINYSRGSVSMRHKDDWRQDIRLDLGREGEVYDFHSIPYGEFNVILNVGYGDAFQFQQYTALQCAKAPQP